MRQIEQPARAARLKQGEGRSGALQRPAFFNYILNIPKNDE